MMNFSGAVKPVYNTLRQSLVFVGDSITWGAYMRDPTETIAYKIQQKINSKYGFTPGRYGGGFMGGAGNYPGGAEIVARNIISDDINSAFINTYSAQFTGGSLLNSADSTVIEASFGIYPFSASTGDTGIKSATNWGSGAITLTSGSIKFEVSYPGSSGYMFLGTMGAGQYRILTNGSTSLGTFSTGCKFTGYVNQNSTTLTITNVTYGTITSGSYLYGYLNALSSPYGDTANTILSYDNVNSTITMSVASPVSGSYTFYALEGSTKLNTIGPFTTTSVTSIWIQWMDFVPVFTVLQTTPIYPTTYTTVQIHARSSYAIGDFSSNPNYPFSGNADVAAKQIMATTIHHEESIAGGFASRPTYVIALGINDVGRGTSVTDYGTRLSRLASALQNTNYRNYGRVILTIPLDPISPNTLDVSGQYKKTIIDIAKQLKCSYIDLSRLKLTSDDYLQSNVSTNDGLHPGPLGTTKIANYYINMLEL
jgi:hypothetical protein